MYKYQVVWETIPFMNGLVDILMVVNRETERFIEWRWALGEESKLSAFRKVKGESRSRL